MNTKVFKINGWIVITTWRSEDMLAFTTYYTSQGKQIERYSDIPKEDQFLIESALDTYIEKNKLIKYSY